MKWRNVALPVLSAAGAALAVFLVLEETPAVTNPSAEPAAAVRLQPPKLPFGHFVVGAGIVEAGTGNIAIGTPVAGIVAQVYVTWGQQVRTGEPLFRIEDRDLQAELPVAQAQAQQAAANLDRSRYQLELAARLHAQHMISVEQYRDRGFAVQTDQAALAAARAEVARLQVEIERHMVRAPVNGRVLQMNVYPGEFAPAGATATPLMLVGDDEHLRVRVDVDEYDALRIVPPAPAVAVVRGDPGVQATLHFADIEPDVIPRKALTGDVTERVDTRVLQVLYTFDRAELPVYVGQHLDVYIRATPAGG